MNDGNRRTVASSTTLHAHRNIIMPTTPAISIFTYTEDTLRRKARILLSEIFYALSVSNRAYYQGVNRF
jgi:hypothetical protein